MHCEMVVSYDNGFAGLHAMQILPFMGSSQCHSTRRRGIKDECQASDLVCGEQTLARPIRS